jgi:hypothetical protein
MDYGLFKLSHSIVLQNTLIYFALDILFLSYLQRDL